MSREQMSPSTRRFAAEYFPDQWTIEERNGVFYVHDGNGHYLRKHSFTPDSADTHIRQLGATL